MKLKSLNKKIRRLVARIEKDTKKLAKLRLKLSASAKKKKRSEKNKPATRAKESPAKKLKAVQDP